MPDGWRMGEDSVRELAAAWGTRLHRDRALAGYTRLAIGGPARLLLEITTEEEMARAYRDIRMHRLPYFVLGEGSNVFVADEGVDGMILVNRCAFAPRFDDTAVEACAGTNWHELVLACTRVGLVGLEFGAGIPGSVGGAVYGNAGAFGQAIADRLLSVRLVNRKGGIEERSRAAMRFSYRDSELKETGEIVLAVRLQLERGDPEAGMAEIARTLALRAEKHPHEDARTAGSFFKNVKPVSSAPRRQAAGHFLEQVGGKELRVGDAGMFEKHANILINYGAARASDVLALTGELSRRVRERFGIALDAEVIYICNDRLHQPDPLP